VGSTVAFAGWLGARHAYIRAFNSAAPRPELRSKKRCWSKDLPRVNGSSDQSEKGKQAYNRTAIIAAVLAITSGCVTKIALDKYSEAS